MGINHIGTRGTYASIYFTKNPNRKIEKTNEEDHSYNVKSISEVYQTGDRKEFAYNTPTKQKRIDKTYNPSPKEFHGKVIDISI